MILMHVTYKCKKNMRVPFLDAIKAEGIDIACRAEVGNFQYDYYIPMDGSDDLLLIEKWQDADALDAHCKQPHFARLGELKKEFVNDTAIEKFEI